jgi:hypothetical protein
MKKLTSNTAFGDYLNTKNIPDCEYRYLRNKFDEFLKQPLELWQFVPCKLVDGVCIVLEEPVFDELLPMNEMDEIYNEYQEAKERVLFEGFEIEKGIDDDMLYFGDTYLGFISEFTNKNQTIEYLIKYKPKLTQNALKQIGL